MKIALAQINPTVGDITGNVEKILQFAAQAREKQADLIIFPELAITGYPPGDLLLKDSFIEANLLALDKLTKNLTDLPAIIGFVDRNPGRGRQFFNAAAFLEKGKIRAKQFKTLLPTYDVFDEDRYFQPATHYQCASVEKYKFGLTICEDAWCKTIQSQGPGSRKTNVREANTEIDANGVYVHNIDWRYFINPMQQVADLCPDFIVNISASPFALGKHKTRENIMRYHARQYGIPIIFVNQVGGNDELVFDGRSFLMDSQGNLLYVARAFTEDLLLVDINDSSCRGGAAAGVGAALAARPRPVLHQPNLSEPSLKSEDADLQDIYQALVLGTRDYVHKCCYQDVVLGVSGGIDSAVVSAIACKALGAKHVLGLSLPSPYSSPGSIIDSQELVKNMGMQLITIPIDKAMANFDQMLKPAFAGKESDVTEENIQARLRGAILMAFSNKFKRLLLTTGNKSELAVGYCTLYGDMCGGLAVISDVPKMRVYELAKLINKEAGYNLIPRSIIDKPPSAELKPGQKDEDTLPPYPVLDAIIQAYIEEGKTPQQIIQAGFTPYIVSSVVGMIEHNEFKRRQAAPGLKLTSRAFGIGWRMPIAQGFHEANLSMPDDQ